MRIVLQRVQSSSVAVDGKILSEIGVGVLLLLGVGPGDSEKEADFLAEKIANLRIFSDENGKMNLSLLNIGGAALVVSQFTLYADCRKGNRPSFIGAAAPDEANRLYEYFLKRLGQAGVKEIGQGEFGADMKVTLLNDGPVTILLERENQGDERAK